VENNQRTAFSQKVVCEKGSEEGFISVVYDNIPVIKRANNVGYAIRGIPEWGGAEDKKLKNDSI